MIYLTYITFPSDYKELDLKFGSSYPYNVLLSFGLKKIDFEPITILYGNNGSGKSTALNIIAETAKINRDSIYNKSDCFVGYVDMCKINILNKIPENSKIITSDDVFDYMLDIRNLNKAIDIKRENICKEYLDAKYSNFQLKSIADYDRLKKVNDAQRKTQTKFVKNRLMGNVKEYSNGETAYGYFIEKIGENGVYILDEPENSLSPKRQIELKSFIEDSVRFFGCQFIISTHSPFLLAMRGAKIYNLDERPVVTEQWTELENVRLYREFFENLL